MLAIAVSLASGSSAFTSALASARNMRQSKVARAAALQPGDTVMVIGLTSGGWPTAKIVTSMLRGFGYNVRPVILKAQEEANVFGGSGIKAYVFGSSEALPACAGLVFADELESKSEKLVACVRGLAAIGPLSRVALLSRPCIDGFRSLEAEMMEVCKTSGAEWTVVQAGQLRGGGPSYKSPYQCGQEVYDAMIGTGFGSTGGWEEEIFDIQQRGLKGGGTSDVAGFGLGPLTLQVPATNRMLAAAALVESLGLDEARNKRIGVASAEGDAPSSNDWASAFRDISAN